ncbi:GNAT family N-acetyltransferase [Salegentibacter sp. HM20]
MTVIKNFRETSFKINDLALVLKKVNKSFQPSLLERLTKRSTVNNFSEYIRKLLSFGNIIIACDSQNIKGLIMFYNNDSKNQEAYISVIAVTPEFQGQGISSELIRFSIRESKNNKMKSLYVKTWPENKAAIKLYEKNGFMILRVDKENILLSLDLT